MSKGDPDTAELVELVRRLNALVEEALGVLAELHHELTDEDEEPLPGG